MIEKRCVNNKPTLFVTEHCPKVLLFGTKTTSKSLCWRMTHRVKCPGEGKETFLCRHARTGLQSRSMVGAMPCARPVTGPMHAPACEAVAW